MYFFNKSVRHFPAKTLGLFTLFVFEGIIGIGPVQSLVIVNPGPKYPPTKGEVWPKPQQETKTTSFYSVNPKKFKFQITDKTCDILERAFLRYSHILSQQNALIRRANRLGRAGGARGQRHAAARREHAGLEYGGELATVRVSLASPCEDLPHLEMVESYNLTVSSNSVLSSDSIWGILRGLETFSQLLYPSDSYTEIRVNATRIEDFPLFAHRGLLLDTGRHFISVSNILTTLDAMSYNKMNVFHWHIVDDQSFPYQSKRFPDLSARGAYHEHAQYSPKDINRIVRAATDRGIRVLPEFDVPGHTRSWGVAYPSLLTKCYAGNDVVGLGPMNPTENATYKFLHELLQEVQEVFPDKYLHVGGDEVDLQCWSSNAELQQYMLKHNMSSVNELHALFMTKVLPQLQPNTRPVVWQEVVDEGVALPDGTLVQIWKDDDITKVVQSGYRAVFSSCWYLDHLESGGDWEEFYDCDPGSMVEPELADRLIGGEACMWGEVVDDRNVISRVWPRASAAAERLWGTAGAGAGDMGAVRARLEEHVCRMARRGVDAQPPNGPGFCLV